MTLRLIRNIFCHETTFDWDNLRELASYSEAFFGSFQRVELFFLAFEECCSFRNPPVSQRSYLDWNSRLSSFVTDIRFHPLSKQILLCPPQRIVAAPDIQLNIPENCAILENLHTKSLSPIVGIKEIRDFLKKPAICDSSFFVVVGDPLSGKTIVASSIIPLLSLSGSPLGVCIDAENLKSSSFLFPPSLVDFLVIELSPPLSPPLLDSLNNIKNSNSHSTLLITTDTKTARLCSTHPLFQGAPIFQITPGSLSDMKDLQRLLRHLYGPNLVDKWELRKALQAIPSHLFYPTNCSLCAKSSPIGYEVN